MRTRETANAGYAARVQRAAVTSFDMATLTWVLQANADTRKFAAERIGLRGCFFVGLMFAINFEYIFVRLYDFDSIWKPYRVLTMAGFMIALPAIIAASRSLFRQISALVVAISYAVLISTLLWFAGNVDIGEVLHHLQLLILGVMLATQVFVVPPGAFRQGMWAFICGLIVNLLYSLVADSSDGGRALGFFRNPNQFGSALAIGVIYLAANLEARGRVFRILIAFFMLGGIFMTGSRGAFGATVVAFVFAVIRSRGARTTIVLGFLLVSLVYSFAGADIQQWLSGYEDGRLANRYSLSEITRAAYRKELASAALNLGVETGFMGVGMEQFRSTHYYDLVSKYEFFDDRYGHALGIHNFYLTLLVEWGAPAFLAMMVFGSRLFRSAQRLGGEAQRFCVGLIVMFGLVAATADITPYQHFWLAIGLVIAIVGYHARQTSR